MSSSFWQSESWANNVMKLTNILWSYLTRCRTRLRDPARHPPHRHHTHCVLLTIVLAPRLRPPHQEKKCASGRTGCVLTHQALGTLWTHPGSAHTATNTKRRGNVNSDAASHGTMRPDAARHGICLPDRAWQGIFVLDARCQGIFLLDTWCQGIFLLNTAVSGYFPSGRSRVRANGIRTTYVMAPWLRWLSRHRTSQQILALHSQTCSGFQA